MSLAAIVVLAGTLTACSRSIYTRFDDKMHRDLPSLLATYERVREDVVAATDPVADPVGGRAILVLPAMDQVVARNRREFDRAGVQLSRDDLARVQMTWEGEARASGEILLAMLRETGLFDRVDLERRADPSAPDPAEADYEIVLSGHDAVFQIWQVRRRDGARDEIEFETFTDANPRPLFRTWLNDIVAAVQGLDAKPMRDTQEGQKG